MKIWIIAGLTLCILLSFSQSFAQKIVTDTYPTESGNLQIKLVGHGSLLFEFQGKQIYVDPYSRVADYSKLPPADWIVLTHEHPDHLDLDAIALIKNANTKFIVSASCFDKLKYGEVMKNGDTKQLPGFAIKAVPAYNIVHKRPDGVNYHPKGVGNGYVFSFGGLDVYVAGDTENIPEMNGLKGVDIAFLPKNLPYTMDDRMFLDAAKRIGPRVLYPYHFSDFNEEILLSQLKNMGIDVKIRAMNNRSIP